MNPGNTEIVVKVENSAGSVNVTVPIRVVGADPLVPTVSGSTVILNETFATATAANFFTAAYREQSSGLPMYYQTSGTPEFGNGQIKLTGARFAAGQTNPKATTKNDQVVNGSFDLSKNWKIQIRFVSGSGSGNFQVMIDNNTTSAGNSLHGEKSRVFNQAANGLNETTITISSADKGPFTANSFLFFRAESSATVVIDQILVETW